MTIAAGRATRTTIATNMEPENSDALDLLATCSSAGDENGDGGVGSEALMESSEKPSGWLSLGREVDGVEMASVSCEALLSGVPVV